MPGNSTNQSMQETSSILPTIVSDDRTRWSTGCICAELTSTTDQDEESEAWIGEWMAARKNRDHMVIATKFTTPYRSYELGKNSHSVNYFGNHRRSLHVSVRDSLKKLQTDWIDLL